MCQEDGTWSGSEPKCDAVKKYYGHNDNYGYGDNYGYDDDKYGYGHGKDHESSDYWGCKGGTTNSWCMHVWLT